jgi:hypothetical protein
VTIATSDLHYPRIPRSFGGEAVEPRAIERLVRKLVGKSRVVLTGDDVVRAAHFLTVHVANVTSLAYANALQYSASR